MAKNKTNEAIKIVTAATMTTEVREPASAQDVQAMLTALKDKKAQIKQAVKDQEFYTKYTWVVPGSIRSPSANDFNVLTHAHGKVCDISCQQCGTVRPVNKQDVFQVKYCKECRATVTKAEDKVKRAEKAAEKRAAGMTPEAIKAKMAELEAELASLAA